MDSPIDGGGNGRPALCKLLVSQLAQGRSLGVIKHKHLFAVVLPGSREGGLTGFLLTLHGFHVQLAEGGELTGVAISPVFSSARDFACLEIDALPVDPTFYFIEEVVVDHEGLIPKSLLSGGSGFQDLTFFEGSSEFAGTWARYLSLVLMHDSFKVGSHELRPWDIQSIMRLCYRFCLFALWPTWWRCRAVLSPTVMLKG
jgi:hypothetical protein